MIFFLSLAYPRALARAGNVHFRKKRWDDAIRYFDKSLAEHRNPDVVTKKNTVVLNNLNFLLLRPFLWRSTDKLFLKR